MFTYSCCFLLSPFANALLLLLMDVTAAGGGVVCAGVGDGGDGGVAVTGGGVGGAATGSSCFTSFGASVMKSLAVALTKQQHLLLFYQYHNRCSNWNWCMAGSTKCNAMKPSSVASKSNAALSV